MDVTREQLEELITRACPSIITNTDFLQWREESTGEPRYYLLASAFVRHLTQLNLSRRHQEFPQVFSLIEELHLRGDDYVCEWATIGILEGLQNSSLHPQGSLPAHFVEFLGPVSKWWWEELELLWSGRIKPPVGSSGRARPANMGNSARALANQNLRADS